MKKSLFTERQSARDTAIEVVLLVGMGIFLWVIDHPILAVIALLSAQLSIILHRRRRYKDSP